jgi:hypothetical protein
MKKIILSLSLFAFIGSFSFATNVSTLNATSFDMEVSDIDGDDEKCKKDCKKECCTKKSEKKCTKGSKKACCKKKHEGTTEAAADGTAKKKCCKSKKACTKKKTEEEAK